MTLRIMLVGLVASLGFELPSGSDVEGWAKASTAWVQAKMVDPSEPVSERKLDHAGPSDCQQVVENCEVPPLACESPKVEDPDVSFEAVLERIANGFAADVLASDRQEPPVDEVAPQVTVEVPASVGLPEGEERGCLVVPADEVKTAEVAWIEADRPAEPVEVTIESPSRLERISSAVRLTREAVEAWAAVMQMPVED
jgi:hypothetical protein